RRPHPRIAHGLYWSGFAGFPGVVAPGPMLRYLDFMEKVNVGICSPASKIAVTSERKKDVRVRSSSTRSLSSFWRNLLLGDQVGFSSTMLARFLSVSAIWHERLPVAEGQGDEFAWQRDCRRPENSAPVPATQFQRIGSRTRRPRSSHSRGTSNARQYPPAPAS